MGSSIRVGLAAWACLLTVATATAADLPESAAGDVPYLIEVAGTANSMARIAVDRIRELAPGPVDVVHGRAADGQRGRYRGVFVLGTPGDRTELAEAWGDERPASGDAYLVKSLGGQPPVAAVSGIGPRGTMYAAYQLADRLAADGSEGVGRGGDGSGAAGESLAGLDVRRVPRVKRRLAFLSAGSHGGEFFRPMLFRRSLRELPRYGFNGVLIIPSAYHGTAAGRSLLPLKSVDDRVVALEPQIDEWRAMLDEIKHYGHEIVICWPAYVPPGYSVDDARAHLAGKKRLPDYEEAVGRYQRALLAAVFDELPQIDGVMFHSLETIGPAEGDYGRAAAIFPLANREISTRVFRAYLGAIDEVCHERGKRMAFWTHVCGIRGRNVRLLREVLFDYPRVTIVEDHYWPNAGWPTLPVMGYLPDDLRATIHTRNPFGMFLITTDGEYYGGGSLPTAYPDPHFEAAREAVRREAELVLIRTGQQDRTRQGLLFHFGEIVPLSAAAALWEPCPPLTELWDDWARRRYGPRAAPEIVRALKQCEVILTKGFTYQGLPLLSHSGLPSYTWRPSDSPHSRFGLFRAPGTPVSRVTNYDELGQADYIPFQVKARSASMAEFRARQQAALEAADEALRSIEAVRSEPRPEDYAHMRRAFEDARWVLGALVRLGEAAHATILLRSGGGDNNADRAALRTQFEDAVKELDSYADRIARERDADFLRPQHFIVDTIDGRRLRAPPLPLTLKAIAADYRKHVEP